MKRLEIWPAIGHNVRYALRRLQAVPGFASAVLLMIALGVGATTTVFCVVNGILLRPLPFREPERLVDLTHTIAISGRSTIDQSDGTFLLYQRHATASFESVGAYRVRDVNLGPTGDATGEAERASAATVTSGFFATLRLVPLHGRALQAEDDRPGAAQVAVLSAALWKRDFAADPAVVGKHLVVDGTEREIVG